MAKILTLASGVLLASSMASSVMAQTPLSTTQSTTAAQFNTTQSQTRVGVGTTTFVGTTSTTSGTLVPISRFDTTTGILVGARMSVNIPYSVSLSALGNVPAAGTGRRVDAISTITGSVSIAGTSISSATLAGSPKCIAGDCANLSTNNTDTASGTIVGNATVATVNLAALAGSGPGSVNFTSRVNATNTQVINSANVNTGTAFSQFMLGGATTAANQYSVTYDYLKFANPSFNSGSTVRTTAVNFGTRFIDSGAASQTLTLTNIGDINTAGLAVNSISRSTNDSNFTTTLTPITNLAANSGQNFAIGLNPTTVGTHTDSFTLNTADYAPGGIGIRPYTLTVNASTTLINHANASFSGLATETSKTLNFGSVSSRGGPVLLNFSLFNIGDANSAGLELFQINGPGNGQFSTTLSPFLNLAGGGTNAYSVSLNPLTLGAANGVYSFLFRDYAPGVTGGRNFTLTLNLVGQVFDPVPEPASWAMMMLGFGLVGAVARRRTAKLA